MPDPLILSLETATPGGSVYLGRGEKELAHRTGDPKISHSYSLLEDINAVLNASGLELSDVDLFACASGPGSFTGLRIGIATLKGLAATLQKPSVGVPTLEAVAYAAGQSQATVAMLPAGRGEVFAQLFSVTEGIVRPLDAAAHLSPKKLTERYGNVTQLLWAGSGALAQREILLSYANQHGIPWTDAHAVDSEATDEWRLAPPEINLASHVAALALQKFDGGQTQDAAAVSAIYVRPSDAELNEQCR